LEIFNGNKSAQEQHLQIIQLEILLQCIFTARHVRSYVYMALFVWMRERQSRHSRYSNTNGIKFSWKISSFNDVL